VLDRVVRVTTAAGSGQFPAPATMAGRAGRYHRGTHRPRSKRGGLHRELHGRQGRGGV